MANPLRLKLIVALSAAALLSGCDDGSGKSTSWLDWIKGKDQPKQMFTINVPADYARETQAGNYLAGQFAQYRQDWTTANKYLDKVIKLDPQNVDLQQRSMVFAMQAGDINRAILLARKVLEVDKSNLLALLFIGVDQITKQDYPEAIRTLSKMPENAITDFIRPILIAWAKTPTKHVDNEALLTAGPMHAYHALLIADYMGNVKDPERYLVNVLTGGGADRHMLESMADVFARQGKPELAKKIYDTLITQSNDSAETSSRVKALEEKRDTLDKGNQAARIETPAQGAAEAFYNMSRVLTQEQSDDSALVFARIAQYLDPAKEDVKMLLANLMIKSEHPEDAIALYKSVKSGSQGYPESRRAAAELLEKMGDIPGSIASLEENYAQDKDVNSLIQIGDVYRRADKHNEAIKAYDHAVEVLGGKVSSDYWHLLYSRGMSYEKIGNFKQAEEDLEAAIKFRPDHPYLLNYLGYSWADQGKKLDKALEMIAKAAMLKPDDGYIADSLGWVYYKMQQYDQAVTELEKAIELVPYDVTVNDHLGDAYWQVGRKNEARFQWQRALNHAKEADMQKSLEIKISDGLVVKKDPVKEAKKAAPDKAVKPQ